MMRWSGSHEEMYHNITYYRFFNAPIPVIIPPNFRLDFSPHVSTAYADRTQHGNCKA